MMAVGAWAWTAGSIRVGHSIINDVRHEAISNRLNMQLPGGAVTLQKTAQQPHGQRGRRRTTTSKCRRGRYRVYDKQAALSVAVCHARPANAYVNQPTASSHNKALSDITEQVTA